MRACGRRGVGGCQTRPRAPTSPWRTATTTCRSGPQSAVSPRSDRFASRAQPAGDHRAPAPPGSRTEAMRRSPARVRDVASPATEAVRWTAPVPGSTRSSGFTPAGAPASPLSASQSAPGPGRNGSRVARHLQRGRNAAGCLAATCSRREDQQRAGEGEGDGGGNDPEPERATRLLHERRWRVHDGIFPPLGRGVHRIGSSTGKTLRPRAGDVQRSRAWPRAS